MSDHIYLKNKELRAKKKGQKSFEKILSHYGWRMVLLSTEIYCSDDSNRRFTKKN